MAGEAIFIGYRRDDTADVAGRIFDVMANRFGKARVFKDVDNIGPGVDFGDYIKTVLPRCRVALILIGPHWLDTKNEAGLRRIDDANDWVRLEIETALATPNLLIIPVLVNGARMPREEDVQPSLASLLRRNAAIVRRDPDFHDDAARLAAAVRASVRTGVLDLSALGANAGKVRRGGLPVLPALLVAGALSAAAAFGVWTLIEGQQSAPVAEPETTQADLARGWQVYRETCGACHSIGSLTFAGLGTQGGPLWDARFPDPTVNPSVIEAAQQHMVTTTESGERMQRAGRPGDQIPQPYSNPAMAMLANGNALPPDLVSYATRHGRQGVLNFLLGYQDAPDGAVVLTGTHYNASAVDGRAGPNLTRMAPALSEGIVAFNDGTAASVAQMAQDVSAFTTWAAGLPQQARGAELLNVIDDAEQDDFETLFTERPALEDALTEHGEAVARQCVSCHTLTPGGANGVGTNLYGVYGGAIATNAGFAYSTALSVVRGSRWSGARLDAYLFAPNSAAPGTSMTFAGVRDDYDRVAIIAYLRRLRASAGDQ